MPTLDMRESYTNDDDSEEVKEPALPAGGEGTQETTSVSEETQESEGEESTETGTAESDDSVGEGEEDDTGKKEAWNVTALERQREDILKDIQELRRERRGLRDQPAEPLIIVPKTDFQDDVDIPPTDLALIERAAKKLGFVKKEEIETGQYRRELDHYKDEWLADHPEYLPENDPEDKKWSTLQKAINGYFKAPPTAREIKKIMDVAHWMVSPGNPLPTRSRATTAASREKINASAKGGTGGTRSTVTPTREKPSLVGLKGFTEEDLEELLT